MVQSRLVSTVNYPQLSAIDDDDVGYDANLYETNIDGVDIVIALGQIKYAFIESNIVYFPVYAVKNSKVDGKIGVYEVMSDMQPFIVDDDEDINIDKLGDILLFSFVDASFLQDKVTPIAHYDTTPIDKSTNENIDTNVIGDDDDSDINDGSDDDIDDKQNKPHSKLDEQDEKQASIERNAYKRSKEESWVNTFMKNNNYSIIENEGGGDCFFAAIRDGLSRVGITLSVDNLRETLVNEATEEVFNGYREMYRLAENEVISTERALKELQGKHNDLKKRATSNKDRDVAKQLIEQGKRIIQEHTTAKLERHNAKSILEEFKFMKNVDTLEKFKIKLKTCDFWGETWAISTLERIMNIKLVLLSERSFVDKDTDNVITCGQLNDTVLEKRGIFSPEHYIILEYVGNHYRLITYKGRGAFSFSELPYDIKMLIVNKCLERAAGSFYLIPEFRKLLSDNQLVVNDEQYDMDTLPENKELYDDNVVFQFYSKSSGQPQPGKGSGEKIPDQLRTEYAELASIKNWRRMLSNFYESEFELSGHRWKSVEHYYQASKFKENNPDFYLSFSLDMNPEGELSKDPVMAKGAGGKTGKYKGKVIRTKDITIDPNFFNGKNNISMKSAQLAKFSQNLELKKMLLDTKNAKLVHFSRGMPPAIFISLMEVRRELNNKNI